MIEVDAARALVLADCRPVPSESVPLAEAVERVLAVDVAARHRHPAADNSAMDGYAVRAADLAGARPEAPVTLRVVGRSRAGVPAEVEVAAGEAVRIFTGALLPAGADAVIIQESVEADGDAVRVRGSVPVGANIRRAGEEFEPGDALLPAGCRLSPAAIGLLAAAGLHKVPVVGRPRVAILVTGDELGQPGHPADANGPMIEAACRQAGAAVVRREQCPDEVDAVAARLAEAADEADLVLSTGSASVGEHDVIADAWAAAGIETVFWQVAMKPGKPVRYGRVGETLCLALPGNPLAALTGFEQFAEPALAALGGQTWQPRPRLRLPLAARQDPGRARTYFLRAELAGEPDTPSVAVPPRQGSAMLLEAARQPLVAVLTGPAPRPPGSPVVAYADASALRGRVLRPAPPLPAVAAIWGPSDSGKTRLVEQLVPALTARGLRVGTVKHATHAPELDHPGKDSHRHGVAGASRVLLLGPSRAALFVHQDAPAELWPWLESFAGEVDLVLVEGFKQTPLPFVRLAEGAGDEFTLERERAAGQRGWCLTRPPIVDALHFPPSVIEALADDFAGLVSGR